MLPDWREIGRLFLRRYILIFPTWCGIRPASLGIRLTSITIGNLALVDVSSFSIELGAPVVLVTELEALVVELTDWAASSVGVTLFWLEEVLTSTTALSLVDWRSSVKSTGSMGDTVCIKIGWYVEVSSSGFSPTEAGAT